MDRVRPKQASKEACLLACVRPQITSPTLRVSRKLHVQSARHTVVSSHETSVFRHAAHMHALSIGDEAGDCNREQSLTHELYLRIFPLHGKPSPEWGLNENQTCAFKRRAECSVQSFASGAGQDRVLLPTLLAIAAGRPGTFVEIGANDGVTGSNTLVYERCFGWSGALIEANPTTFAKLAGAGRNRSTSLHSAVCADDDPYGHVNITVRGDYMSGDLLRMPKSIIRKYGRWINGAQAAVPCRSLSSLISSAGLRERIDLLSLDVQGSEERVLKTVNPARFNVVLVELDSHDRQKDELVRHLLLNASFERAKGIPRLWTDEVWIHTSVRHLVAPYVNKRQWIEVARQLNFTSWFNKY